MVRARTGVANSLRVLDSLGQKIAFVDLVDLVESWTSGDFGCCWVLDPTRSVAMPRGSTRKILFAVRSASREVGSPPRPESNKREVKIKREVGTPPGSDSNKRDVTPENFLRVVQNEYCYSS